MRNCLNLLQTFTLLASYNRANVSVNDIIAAFDDLDMSISGSEDESDGYEPEKDDNRRKSGSSLSQSSDEHGPLAQTSTSNKGSNKQKNAKKIGRKDCLMLKISYGVASLILVMSGIHHLNS